MAVLAEKMFIIKEDKSAEFAAVLKKPMISKAFLNECKKSAMSVKKIQK